MDCVPAQQMPGLQRGDGNYFGVQLVERLQQVRQVGRIRQNEEVQVAAKFRCAVEYARLAPHKERSRATPLDRRKGFEYRALAQVILQARDRFPTALRIQGNADRKSVVSGTS